VPFSLTHSGEPEFPRRVAEDRSGGRVLSEARPWERFEISNLETSRPDTWKRLLEGTLYAQPFVSVAWILLAGSTRSLCPPSHICCDEP